MGLLDDLEGRAAEVISEDKALKGLFGGGVRTDAGIDVSEMDARQYSAFFNAVYLISSYLGMISLKLYERDENGGKSEIRTHPLFDVLHLRPNPEMSAASLREALQGHILVRGNAYAEIRRNGRGQVNEVWPLDPTQTQLDRTEDGMPFYRIIAGSEPTRLAFDSVLHIPGLGFDGRRGWSVLKLARDSVGLGLASEKYGSRFFSNSARPSGILTTPEELTDDAKRRLKESWEMSQGGLSQAQRTAVLEQGLEWQSIGMSNEDAQFLELRQHQVEEVARWFNIPPHKIKDLRRATFDNISQEQISFLQDTLQPWLNRWEQAINTQLLTRRERRRGLFAEFNVDTVLRSDPEQRAEMIRTRFQTGTWSPNDVRSLENENPIDSEAGDSYFVQSNMITLEQAESLPPASRAMLKASAEGDTEAVEALADAYKEELRHVDLDRAFGSPNDDPDGTSEERQDGAASERQRLRRAFRPLIEDSAERLVRAETQDLRSELGRLFEEGGAAAFIEFINEFYDREDGQISGIIRRTMEPTLRSYTEAVVQAVGDDLGIELGDDFADRLLNAEDRGLLVKFIDKHAASSRKQLRALAQEPPEDPDAEPRDVVERRLDEWQNGRDDGEGPSRSVKIAREETVSFGEAAAVAGMSEGGVTFKEWRSVPPSCPICEQLDGTIVGIEENFVGGGDNLVTDEVDFQPFTAVGHSPAHQSCDCLIVASGG